MGLGLKISYFIIIIRFENKLCLLKTEKQRMELIQLMAFSITEL